MSTYAEEQQARLEASVQALRLQELEQGFPYMIGPTPENPVYFYYEYPDGRIAVVYYPKPMAPHEVIRWLTVKQTKQLRAELNLMPAQS